MSGRRAVVVRTQGCFLRGLHYPNGPARMHLAELLMLEAAPCNDAPALREAIRSCIVMTYIQGKQSGAGGSNTL